MLLANSLDGPFTQLEHFSYPAGPNVAPIYHRGALYMTNQHTAQIWTTPALVQPNKLRLALCGAHS